MIYFTPDTDETVGSLEPYFSIYKTIFQVLLNFISSGVHLWEME